MNLHSFVRSTRLAQRASLLVAGGALLFSAAGALAQDGQATQEEATPDLAPIRAAIEELRELKFKRDVPAERQSLEDFKAFAMAEMEEEFPAERFRAVLEGVLRFGLVQERFDLGETVLNALLSQAGGYYNPENGTFYYLMGGLGEDGIRTIAAHELVHAMQDQHFDLLTVTEELSKVSMPESGPRQDDRVLAVRSLIEGEATYVQIIWQLKDMMGMDIRQNPAMERQALSMQANMTIEQLAQAMRQQMAMMGQEMPEDIANAMEQMNEIPRYILEPMYAAYFKGAYFSMAVRQKSGWDGLNKVYQNMPVSTEQVLHPEKYLENVDLPTIIELPDLLYVDEAGWSEIDSAVHGQFYLDLMLRQQGVSRNIAQTASRGWDGDIYRAYRNEAGQVFFVFASTWDGEADAREFASAYAASLQKKLNVEVALGDDESRASYMYTDPFGPAPKADAEAANDAAPNPPQITGGATIEPAGANDAVNARAERLYGSLIVRGREVFIVEGLADKALMEKVIESLTNMTIEYVD